MSKCLRVLSRHRENWSLRVPHSDQRGMSQLWFFRVPGLGLGLAAGSGGLVRCCCACDPPCSRAFAAKLSDRITIF